MINLFQIIENDSLSTSLYINDNKVLNRNFGVQDAFLKVLETLSGTVINLRGNLITIKGDNSKSKLVITQLIKCHKVIKQRVIKEDVKSLYHFESSSNNDVLANDVVIKTPRKNIFARTEKQKTYINNLAKNNIIFSLGPVGTGKTYLA